MRQHLKGLLADSADGLLLDDEDGEESDVGRVLSHQEREQRNEISRTRLA